MAARRQNMQRGSVFSSGGEMTKGDMAPPPSKKNYGAWANPRISPRDCEVRRTELNGENNGQKYGELYSRGNGGEKEEGTAGNLIQENPRRQSSDTDRSLEESFDSEFGGFAARREKSDPEYRKIPLPEWNPEENEIMPLVRKIRENKERSEQTSEDESPVLTARNGEGCRRWERLSGNFSLAAELNRLTIKEAVRFDEIKAHLIAELRRITPENEIFLLYKLSMETYFSVPLLAALLSNSFDRTRTLDIEISRLSPEDRMIWKEFSSRIYDRMYREMSVSPNKYVVVDQLASAFSLPRSIIIAAACAAELL